MKTKSCIRRIAKLSTFSLAVLFASAVSPAQDSFEGDPSGNSKIEAAFDSETQAAFERLGELNNVIEESLMFTAPSDNEDVVAYELQEAEERLGDLNLSIEESLKYQASRVNEEAEAYDLEMAKERLNDISLAIEEMIKFQSPSDGDNEIVPERMEYVSYKTFTIPVSEMTIGQVLAR